MLTETIDDDHDYRHAPDDAANFNESTYYNFAAADGSVTGWVRVAFQPNQPAAQASVLLFLPEETLFCYRRVEDASATELVVADLTFEILEPHRSQRLCFDGSVASFADARALLSPGDAFRNAPRREVQVELAVTARGVPFGTNGDDVANPFEPTMASGHFEQFIEVRGEIVVDGRVIPVDGAGMRDHSWGPRDWAGPSWYRWITATLEDDTSIMLLQVARRDGAIRHEAIVRKDGVLHAAEFDGIEMEWTPDGFGRRVSCVLRTAGDEIVLTAQVQDERSFTPLRHSRPGDDGSPLETRIGYAPYLFATSDGRVGRGIVEVLDQLVDGAPVSMRSQSGAA